MTSNNEELTMISLRRAAVGVLGATMLLAGMNDGFQQQACRAGEQATAAVKKPAAAKPVAIDSRRELFVDYFLIDQLTGTRLELNHPINVGNVFQFDKPWEGIFSGYVTVIKDGGRYRLYYRGRPEAGADGRPGECTCYAESSDGIHWTKPDLGLFEVGGSKHNNVILTESPYTHNFCPMLDTRPGVVPEQRYKALGGVQSSGLVAFVSADGIQWKKLQDKAVFTQGAFDSQNLAFWSEAENCYLCYFRVFANGVRRISRTTSQDFVHWAAPELMQYERRGGPVPLEHLYTNQTGAYFRAPHIYVATAARFMPGRQAITDQQAAAIHVHPSYYKDVSDSVLLTSRGGNVYDRTFMEGFVRSGIGPENWVSRTNYPALNVVETGPTEMSMYVHHNYGQPTAHLCRYVMRLDGFGSVRAPYDGGEMVTKPLTFTGKRLMVNFATSAAGGIRVEVQDAAGKPIPGFALAESIELIGNEIEREVAWKGGPDLGTLSGKPIRLRFVMKDADLYALRFAP